MKSLKQNYGLYAILVVLGYYFFKFLYQFKFSGDNAYLRLDLMFGPLYWVFLLLLVAAIVSIFVVYKYNRVVISLPFFWNLLLPLKIAPGSGFRGTIINMFAVLFQGDITTSLLMLLGSILGILCVTYLFVKNIKQIENNKFEIISAVLIILFFLWGIIQAI